MSTKTTLKIRKFIQITFSLISLYTVLSINFRNNLKNKSHLKSARFFDPFATSARPKLLHQIEL